MRAITKGPEPPSLTAHRQSEHSTYANYDDKDGLRQSLVTEQRGLCCYCMGRIYDDGDMTKIEHWRSQRHHPTEQLSYRNLLGACMGGQGQPPHRQHCDTHKGDLELQWNPAEPGHHIETRIRYEIDGAIRSDETQFDAELDAVLNLNLAILKNHRKGVLDAIREWWQREKARLRGPVPSERFERERARYTSATGELTPYSQVAVWWLSQRLNRMAP